MAMLALVTDRNGKAVGVHRTYLSGQGDKAPVPSPKKLAVIRSGATVGGAVRLKSPIETLGISEGIETALAVHISTGIPMWAAISAGGMRSLIIPHYVSSLIIFADNDANGVEKRLPMICELG